MHYVVVQSSDSSACSYLSLNLETLLVSWLNTRHSRCLRGFGLDGVSDLGRE